MLGHVGSCCGACEHVAGPVVDTQAMLDDLSVFPPSPSSPHLHHRERETRTHGPTRGKEDRVTHHTGEPPAMPRKGGQKEGRAGYL